MSQLAPQKSLWFVYIVLCADRSFYTGITTDCARREREHNGFGKKGARYTRARRPVKMVWSEVQDNRSLAAKREYTIKKMSRQQKQALVVAKAQNTE